jgi:hypothetical protein
MKETQKGWAVIHSSHPHKEFETLMQKTFASTRTQSISKFMEGLSEDWTYWKRNYDYKCVKVELAISVI